MCKIIHCVQNYTGFAFNMEKFSSPQNFTLTPEVASATYIRYADTHPTKVGYESPVNVCIIIDSFDFERGKSPLPIISLQLFSSHNFGAEG